MALAEKTYLFQTDEEKKIYSKLSIKHPFLNGLNFSKKSIKGPGPSQKKLIVLFYFRAATAGLDIWKKSLSNNQCYF